MKTNRTDSNFINIAMILLASFLIVSFCFDTTGDVLLKPQFYGVFAAFILIVVVLGKRARLDSVIWTVILGSLLKLCYISYTAVWNRQHDVIDFGVGEGHAGYIEYILYNRHLPDFDPREVWSFFQPPLHHTVAALWMWIQARLGMAENIIKENVQVLTLFYCIITVIMAYFLCRKFDMKKRGMLITMVIVSFHPIFILLSGSINNDALALCLSMVAVYVAVCWYEDPGFITIILLGILIGLAMAAKLTSGLIAPAIGALMIYSLIKNRDKWKRYLAMFASFGAVVFPIGLYWPIRNKLLWDMPVNYIPEVGEQLSRTDILSRLFDVRIHSVYPAMITNGDTYDEYNTLVQMLKSSLFGEYNYGQFSRYITPFAIILFVLGLVLALLALYATVYMIFAKGSMMTVDRKIYLGLLYAVFVAGYFSFSLGYSNFSAEDFRYSALAIIIEALFLGIWADEGEEKVARIVLGLSIAFGLASAAVYLLVGIFQ